MSVRVSHSQTGDRHGVRLNLARKLKGQLPDLDRTRIIGLAYLTHTRDQVFATVVNHYLGDVVLELW